MPAVQWIKLTTTMFDDEKIKLIESMPDKDAILIIWIKLLVQAGKCNATGYIYLSETLPYTDEMLATIFNRPLNTVRLALKVFREFGMIELSDDGSLFINNWEKHQNIAGLDKIREQTRLRVAKHRELKKLTDGVTGTVTLRNGTDKNKNKKRNILSSEMVEEVISYLNEKTGKHFSPKTKATISALNARWQELEPKDIKAFKFVIDAKCKQWLNDPARNMYLRPITLFGTKFESYLNEEIC